MDSSSAMAASSLEYFNEHGIFYLEDTIIGSLVKQVDEQGLSTNTESWNYFKDHVLANPVSGIRNKA